MPTAFRPASIAGSSTGSGPRTAESVIKRTNLDPAYAQQAFGVLEQRGVITRADATGATWMLRHEVLTPRVRELTAPARARHIRSWFVSRAVWPIAASPS